MLAFERRSNDAPLEPAALQIFLVGQRSYAATVSEPEEE